MKRKKGNMVRACVLLFYACLLNETKLIWIEDMIGFSFLLTITGAIRYDSHPQDVLLEGTGSRIDEM